MDNEPPAHEMLSGKSDVAVKQEAVDTELCEKISFKEKMKDILSCRMCCELRRCPMYQCKYGHLMCAGCFNDIMSESQIQNEIASCPTCQTTITKNFSFRNVAVEKTISELPIACVYCSEFFQPLSYCFHESTCAHRPVTCSNAVIGCSWRGSNVEKETHEKNCKQLSWRGDEILASLTVIDCQQKKEESLYNQIMDLFSVEKISYSDLQLKQLENEGVMQTSKFSAFDNQWLLCVYNDVLPVNNIPAYVTHKLLLKTRPTSSLNVNYMILPGPYNDMEIKPDVYQFEFTDDAMETPHIRLELPRFIDRQRIYSVKRINIRIVMFVVK